MYRTISNTLRPRNGYGFEPAIDRFFARAADVPVWSGGADVEELDNEARITLDVPGVKAEQIQISVENRTVSLKVERDGRGQISRQYTIGSKYDLSQLSAKLELGVLTLVLPRAVESQPRSIPVSVA